MHTVDQTGYTVGALRAENTEESERYQQDAFYREAKWPQAFHNLLSLTKVKQHIHLIKPT